MRVGSVVRVVESLDWLSRSACRVGKRCRWVCVMGIAFPGCVSANKKLAVKDWRLEEKCVASWVANAALVGQFGENDG